MEYAHAMAPGANIVLDVAATSSGNAINPAEAQAIADFPGAVFSQSFGIPESFITANDENVTAVSYWQISVEIPPPALYKMGGNGGHQPGWSPVRTRFGDRDGDWV